MKKIIYTLAFVLFVAFSAKCQAPVNYNDVGVIVNIKDTTSVNIGNYFMSKRNIPKGNLIKISCSTKEEIDSLQFDSIRKQLEDTLTAKKLTKKLNYLVTTRGVPLKVSRSPVGCYIAATKTSDFNKVHCSSVDAEIMLILTNYKGSIGGADVWDTINDAPNFHPYYESSKHFSNSDFGIYLVSRLSAATQKEVYNLIDSSGPYTLVNKDSALFVLDMEKTNIYIDTFLNHQIGRAYPILKNRGWNVLLDSSDTYLRYKRNVLGYISWGATDDSGKIAPSRGRPFNKWLPASIGTMYYSYTASSFNIPAKNPGGLTLCASMVREGCRGVSGTTYEPYAFTMTDPVKLLEKYTDESQTVHFNLAESFYAASPTYSWMWMVVGDPKTSIISKMPAKPSAKIDTITRVCQNTPRTLPTSKNLTGLMNWFKGDSIKVKADGATYDSTHKDWVQEGADLKVPTKDTGTFTYTYVNENISGKSFSQVTFKVVRCSVSMNPQPKERNNYTILPNPNEGSFQLQRTTGNGEVTVIVKDITGRIIQTKTIFRNNSLLENLSIEKAGLYFIDLLDENGHSSLKMMVK